MTVEDSTSTARSRLRALRGGSLPPHPALWESRGRSSTRAGGWGCPGSVLGFTVWLEVDFGVGVLSQALESPTCSEGVAISRAFCGPSLDRLSLCQGLASQVGRDARPLFPGEQG
jgi:hypothetical protein